MKLRFDEKKICFWSQRYQVPKIETDLIKLKGEIQRKRQLTKSQLQLVCSWKAPRSAGHVEKNDEEFVTEVTEFALKAKSERTRIEVLTVLDGVLWPTASVVLHLFHSDRYPILDFRALWSVGTTVPTQYSFEFWWCYVRFCRSLAKKNHASMRILDRALWQYSKENQPSSSGP